MMDGGPVQGGSNPYMPMSGAGRFMGPGMTPSTFQPRTYQPQTVPSYQGLLSQVRPREQAGGPGGLLGMEYGSGPGSGPGVGGIGSDGPGPAGIDGGGAAASVGDSGVSAGAAAADGGGGSGGGK